MRLYHNTKKHENNTHDITNPPNLLQQGKADLHVFVRGWNAETMRFFRHAYSLHATNRHGMQIGIAITTVPERLEIHAIQMQYIEKYTPADVPIYIHNDYKKEGIAISKNRCIEALMALDCTHIFLLDDDIYPTSPHWIEIYTDTNLPHACLNWSTYSDGTYNGNKLLRQKSDIEYYSSGQGVLLYFTREAIERIGGMDCTYTQWGHEHGGLASRIKNAGLIINPFPSPVGAMQHFYSYDHQKSNASVFSKEEKQELSTKSNTLRRMESQSQDWKPYKFADYILTAHYTSARDEQRPRGNVMHKNYLLTDTAPCDVVCLTDSKRHIISGTKYVYSEVQKGISLYNQRFIEFYRWLKKYQRYVDVVYLLDYSDTYFQTEFKHKIEKGKVYINSEQGIGNVRWLEKMASNSFPKQHLLKRGADMWNAGVIYGHAADVLKLLEAMQPYLHSDKMACMTSLNMVCNQGIEGIEFIPMDSSFKRDATKNVYICHKPTGWKQ